MGEDNDASPIVEEDEESEDQDRPEWEDMKTLIENCLMFGSLSSFSLERVEKVDFSELVLKIEENLNHKPGPNPVIVRGHYVNRRPFRKLCSASFFHILICLLLFFVPVYPECILTRNLHIIHLFIIILFYSSLPQMSLDKEFIGGNWTPLRHFGRSRFDS